MMKAYIGTKIIHAEPCKLGYYNRIRGMVLPENEDPERQGYHVLYPDGYQSWSPKETFDAAYRLVTGEEHTMLKTNLEGYTD